jgi:hypothetical protein
VGWRVSGFSVHSKVKASLKEEAERVGKYMIPSNGRPMLSLERISFDEKEGKPDTCMAKRPKSWSGRTIWSSLPA